MVKAKFNQDDDPFKEVPTPKCFMRGSERARQTLGQVVSYATAHLDQFRTHVFFILLFHDSARLMRWEHIGFIVRGSASVCPTFKQFFLRFNHADVMERGHDPAVTPFKFTKNWRRNFFLTSFSLLLTLATRIFQIARAVKPGALRHTDLEKSMLRLWDPNMRNSPLLRFSISLLCSIIAT